MRLGTAHRGVWRPWGGSAWRGRVLLAVPLLMGAVASVSAVSARAAAAAPTATAISVTPPGPVGVGGIASYAVHATNNGAAVQGVTIGLNVTAGPDASGRSNYIASCVTDASGNCTVSYTAGNTPGTDTVVIWADNNGNQLLDPGEPSQTVSQVIYGPPYKVVLSPSAPQSAVNGACVGETATVTDAVGNPVPGATLSVQQTQQAAGGASINFTFFANGCTGSGTTTKVTNPSSSPANVSTTSPTNNTGASGAVAFGLGSDTAGTETLLAYYGALSPSAPQASNSITWVASGANNVTGLTAQPTSGTHQGAGTVTFTVTPTISGLPAVGIPVNYEITSGPDATAPPTLNLNACTTGASGSCTITTPTLGAVAGTDAFTFWVNQTTVPNPTPGPDPGEPQATATWTFTPAPANVAAVDVSCADAVSGTTVTNGTCTLPVAQGSETLTAAAKDPTGKGVAGAVITMTISAKTLGNKGATATLSASSCTTGSTGTCTVQLTNSNPANNDSVTVQAALEANGGLANSATIQWQTPAPAKISLSPGPDNSSLVDTSVTFTATVTDQFRNPVAGDPVTFSILGGTRGNSLGTTCSSLVTNAAGQASCSYKDGGSATVDGQYDSVGARDPSVFSPSVTQYWYTSETPKSLALGTGSSCAGTPVTSGSNQVYGLAATNVSMGVGWCVNATNANGDVLYGQPITLSSSFTPAPGASTTAMQGVFTDANGVQNQGTSQTVTITTPSGAPVDVASSTTGNQGVSAAMGSLTAQGTQTWTPAPAKAISVHPASQTAPIGTQEQLLVNVADGFGNGVSNICFPYSVTSPASIVGANPPLTDCLAANLPSYAMSGVGGTTSIVLSSVVAGTSHVSVSLFNAQPAQPLASPNTVDPSCQSAPRPRSCDAGALATWALAAPTITAPTTYFSLGDIAVQWTTVPGATAYSVHTMSAPWNGSFGRVSRTTTAGTSLSVAATGHFGKTMCFQVAAAVGGVTGPYSSWRCSAFPVAAPNGSWSLHQFQRVHGSQYLRGTALAATARGATAVLSGARWRVLSVVTHTGPGEGSIQVWVDGHLKRRISLNSGRSETRLLRVDRSSSTQTSTVMIKVGSSGRPVYVEGLGAWQQG